MLTGFQERRPTAASVIKDLHENQVSSI